MVRRPSGAVAHAEATRSRAEASAAARVAEDTDRDAAAVAAIVALDDVRVPIRILLEIQFGEPNENQEEMLEAARRAADVAEAGLGRVRRIAELDRGDTMPRREAIRLADVLPLLLRGAEARARSAGGQVIRFTLDVVAPEPRVRGDLTMLHDAPTLVIDDAAIRTRAGDEIAISCHAPEHAPDAADDGRILDPLTAPRRQTRVVETDVTFAPSRHPTAGPPMARRLVEAQEGSIEFGASATRIRLPTASSSTP